MALTIEVQTLDDCTEFCPFLSVERTQFYADGTVFHNTFKCEHLRECMIAKKSIEKNKEKETR